MRLRPSPALAPVYLESGARAEVKPSRPPSRTYPLGKVSGGAVPLDDTASSVDQFLPVKVVRVERAFSFLVHGSCMSAHCVASRAAATHVVRTQDRCTRTVVCKSCIDGLLVDGQATRCPRVPLHRGAMHARAALVWLRPQRHPGGQSWRRAHALRIATDVVCRSEQVFMCSSRGSRRRCSTSSRTVTSARRQSTCTEPEPA